MLFRSLVATDAPLDDASRQRWAALLTYGEPYRGPTEGVRIVVTPRLGTVSPWASKATDIARNCGLSARRVERVVEYWLTLQAPGLGAFRKRPAALDDAQWHACAALLHDRMTESVLRDLEQARALFVPLAPQPLQRVDVLGRGRVALQEANVAWGLALRSEERRVGKECRL